MSYATSALQEQEHLNPDGTTVWIYVHPSASIGANAVIGDGAVIGANAVIGDGAVIGANAVIGDRASIGAYAEIGDRARIGVYAVIGDRARIGGGASIEAGDSMHWFSGFYYCDAYRDAGGVPVLRHGCVTLPLAEWTPDRQAELCKKHGKGPEVARSLARAVAAAQAFFAADPQGGPQ